MVEEDIELLIEWRADPRVNHWYGGLTESTPEVLRADWDDEAWCERGIIELGGRPIGFIQWYPVDEGVEQIYRLPNGPTYWGIDMYLGLPDLFGQGLGTQVVRDLSDALLRDGTADVVVIDPQIRNQRAIRSYEKAGFVHSHPLPHHELHDGEWMDAVLMVKTTPSAT